MKRLGFKKLLKRVVCFFLIAAAVFSLTSVLASAVIFRVMFGRLDEITSYAEIRYSMLNKTYPRREISFDSGGNILRGYLYTTGDRGLVVIVPGANSDCDTHLAEIAAFADGGYSVLVYDPTGTCLSDGDGTVGLQQSRRDLISALGFVRRDGSLSRLPVFLYGHSLGAYAAASVLSEENVSAAVCVAGFNSPIDTMYGMARERVGVLADIEYPFLRLQSFLTFGDDADKTAIDGINSCDTPVMLVRGSNDEVVPYPLSISALEDELENPNVSLKTVSGKNRGGHAYQWLSDDSAAYVNALQERYGDLKSLFDGDIPDEALSEFYGSVDVDRAVKTDGEFMSSVLDFYGGAVSRSFSGG